MGLQKVIKLSQVLIVYEIIEHFHATVHSLFPPLPAVVLSLMSARVRHSIKSSVRGVFLLNT